MPVSPESPHTSNIKWTEQVVLRNREAYTYTHMHALKIRVHECEGEQGPYMREFGGRKEKGEMRSWSSK